MHALGPSMNKISGKDLVEILSKQRKIFRLESRALKLLEDSTLSLIHVASSCLWHPDWGGGGGSTPIFELYRYVPSQRVSFSVSPNWSGIGSEILIFGL